MELYKLATSLHVRPVFDISKTETKKSTYIMLLINRNLPIICPIIETHFSNQLPQLKYNSYKYIFSWETTAVNLMLYDKESIWILEIVSYTSRIIISISMEYDFYNQSFWSTSFEILFAKFYEIPIFLVKEALVH